MNRTVIGNLARDLRHAFRGLARTPGFTSIAVLTLAIGIGATTAVFSVANWVLLRPVPGTAEPDRLVRVRMILEDHPEGTFSISHPNYADLRSGSTTLSDLAATFDSPVSLAVDGGDQPRRVDAGLVTANYFDVLGMRPALGRTFTEREGRTVDANPVVVISHRLWHGTFGGDPSALGRTVAVNGRPFTVIGVAAQGFRGDQLPGEIDLWMPATMHRQIVPGRGDDLLTDRGEDFYLGMVGRLAPGIEGERAEAELRRIMGTLLEAHPGENRLAADLGLLPDLTLGVGAPEHARAGVEQTVRILAGIVGLLLLLTCANVANLLLARTSRRRRELAVRRALGAGRRRLAGLFLAESTLLALAGAAVALLLATWLGGLLAGVQLAPGLAPLGEMRPDARVFGFTVLAAIGTASVFAAVPALAASRQDPAQSLGSGARSATTGRPLLRNGLVVAQIGISLALVVGAGLLGRTVNALQALDMGFETERVLTFSVDIGAHGYEDQRRRDFQHTLLERIRAVPGVRSAGAAWLSLIGGMSAGSSLAPYGRDPGEDGIRSGVNRVSPGFFDALEMPLTEGRGFREAEYPRSGEPPRVTVLSESLARELFPDGGPVVGRLLATRGNEAPLEVIGVARDARTSGPEEEPGHMQYLPMAAGGRTPGSFSYYVRTTAGPTTVIGTIREAVQELDPSVPIYDVRTLREQVNTAIAEQRAVAGLSGVFALLAMLIAAIGLYGIMAYYVSERTREFGIRTALGADGRRVLRLVMRQALAVAAVGLVLGALGATQLTRLIESRLYGVTRLDPLTFALAAAVLTAAVLVASYIPARRATRIDPMVALREE